MDSQIFSRNFEKFHEISMGLHDFFAIRDCQHINSALEFKQIIPIDNIQHDTQADVMNKHPELMQACYSNNCKEVHANVSKTNGKHTCEPRVVMIHIGKCVKWLIVQYSVFSR